MNDSHHPQDDVLFDFVEGTLDDDRASQLTSHLEHCAACAGFVAAARDGVCVDAREPMPAVAVERMHLALGEAWVERELATSPAEVIDTHALETPTPRQQRRQARRDAAAARRGPRRERMRWVAPALAFTMLAVLAGTSVFLVDNGDGGAGPSKPAESKDKSATSLTPESSEEFADGDSLLKSAAPQAADAGAPATPAPDEAGADDGAADADANSEKSAVGRDAASVASPTSGGTSTAAVSGSIDPSQYRICVATTDEAQLVLPDGRIPQRIITGPFGVLVVCG